MMPTRDGRATGCSSSLVAHTVQAHRNLHAWVMPGDVWSGSSFCPSHMVLRGHRCLSVPRCKLLVGSIPRNTALGLEVSDAETA